MVKKQKGNVMENSNKSPIYVVYGSSPECEFGHTYFEDEVQAKNYQIYKNRTKWSCSDNYFMEEVKIEDKSVDYSKINLFLIIALVFDNFEASKNEITESKPLRQLRYYEDNDKNQIYKENTFFISVEDYTKPEISINYNLCINDEKEINSLLNRINNLNKNILKEASSLCAIELEKNKNIKSDIDNDYIVSKTLNAQFEKEVEMFINS